LLPIHQISLPTPWPAVGPVHVYLIRQEPVTLIDTGLSTPESREALRRGLAELGLTVKEIKRVLLTHAHLDHFGQTAWIVSESGAEVYMHPDEAGKTETPDWWRANRDRTLEEAGVPLAICEVIDRAWQRSRRMLQPLGTWRPLADGQRFAFE
jgi:glyoxylase-like metal-dependent hydrolase (beta-lactamase superfamily II)